MTPPPHSPPSTGRGRSSSWPLLLLDAAAVVAFAAAGRASHAEDVDAGGVLATAWPFLAGLALGWLVSLLLRRSPAGRVGGAVVWAVAVAGGMALRRVSGDGTDPAFVVVAALVLGVLLTLGRVLVRAVGRTGR